MDRGTQADADDVVVVTAEPQAIDKAPATVANDEPANNQPTNNELVSVDSFLFLTLPRSRKM